MRVFPSSIVQRVLVPPYSPEEQYRARFPMPTRVAHTRGHPGLVAQLMLMQIDSTARARVPGLGHAADAFTE